jgi:ubiquitin-conjugating enzyme E2 J1
MQQDTSTLYTAAPLDDNLFEWHFTIRGPKDTEFEGGVYHGRILFPSDYPFRPPDIVFLTKNGRFELEKKICLTISSHHEETWRPSWSIRTVLVALIAFLPTRGDGAIASLDWSPEERKRLALQSLNYKCDKCGSHNSTCLRPEDANETLTADDVPEELQLRDSKKVASASGAAPSSSSSTSSSSSHSAQVSGGSHTEANATLEAETDQTQNPEVLPQDTQDHGFVSQNQPLQHANAPAATSDQANELNQAMQTLRDQIDMVLSFFVLLIGILLIRKLYIYL